MAVSAVTAAVFLSRAGGRFTLMPVLAASAFGYGAGELGALFTAMALVNLAGVVPAAGLADRFGRKVAIVPSLLLIALAFVGLSSASTARGFVLASMLLALGTTVIGPAPAAFAADIAPARLRGVALGAYRSAGDLGFLVGPVLLGAIADLSSIATALLANAGLSALAGLWFAYAASERPAPAEDFSLPSAR